MQLRGPARGVSQWLRTTRTDSRPPTPPPATAPAPARPRPPPPHHNHNLVLVRDPLTRYPCVTVGGRTTTTILGRGGRGGPGGGGGLKGLASPCTVVRVQARRSHGPCNSAPCDLQGGGGETTKFSKQRQKFERTCRAVVCTTLPTPRTPRKRIPCRNCSSSCSLTPCHKECYTSMDERRAVNQILYHFRHDAPGLGAVT
jgi:hypothetical protein